MHPADMVVNEMSLADELAISTVDHDELVTLLAASFPFGEWLDTVVYRAQTGEIAVTLRYGKKRLVEYAESNMRLTDKPRCILYHPAVQCFSLGLWDVSVELADAGKPPPFPMRPDTLRDGCRDLYLVLSRVAMETAGAFLPSKWRMREPYVVPEMNGARGRQPLVLMPTV